MINKNKLKVKADENHKTGQWAEDKGYYDVAVSRYYYCAYQKMIYILKEKGLYKEVLKGSNSHNHMIEEFNKSFNNKLDGKAKIELSKMHNLRKLRNSADYKDEKVANSVEFSLTFKYNYNSINEILDNLL